MPVLARLFRRIESHRKRSYLLDLFIYSSMFWPSGEAVRRGRYSKWWRKKDKERSKKKNYDGSVSKSYIFITAIAAGWRRWLKYKASLVYLDGKTKREKQPKPLRSTSLVTRSLVFSPGRTLSGNRGFAQRISPYLLCDAFILSRFGPI